MSGRGYSETTLETERGGEKEATRRRTGLLPLRLFLISNGTGGVYEFGEEEGGK